MTHLLSRDTIAERVIIEILMRISQNSLSCQYLSLLEVPRDLKDILKSRLHVSKELHSRRVLIYMVLGFHSHLLRN